MILIILFYSSLFTYRKRYNVSSIDESTASVNYIQKRFPEARR